MSLHYTEHRSYQKVRKYLEGGGEGTIPSIAEALQISVSSVNRNIIHLKKSDKLVCIRSWYLNRSVWYPIYGLGTEDAEKPRNKKLRKPPSKSKLLVQQLIDTAYSAGNFKLNLEI